MIRRAEIHELKACAEIMSDSQMWERYQRGSDEALEFFSAEFDTGSQVWVYDIGGGVIAYLVMIEKGMMGEFPFIRALGVRRDYRGRGVGKKLLDFACETMFRLKPKLFLMVSDFNEAAQKLYYGYGFEKVGEIADYKKEGIAEYIMLKRITDTENT